jgi:hypothetical protein
LRSSGPNQDLENEGDFDAIVNLMKKSGLALGFSRRDVPPSRIPFYEMRITTYRVQWRVALKSF